MRLASTAALTGRAAASGSGGERQLRAVHADRHQGREGGIRCRCEPVEQKRHDRTFKRSSNHGFLCTAAGRLEAHFDQCCATHECQQVRGRSKRAKTKAGFAKGFLSCRANRFQQACPSCCCCRQLEPGQPRQRLRGIYDQPVSADRLSS